MRNMSFAMTTEQVRNRMKFVTRRFGWWDIKPGQLVQPIVKGMGLKAGEHVEKIGGPIRVVSARPEPLRAVTPEECVLEGFPDMTPREFVAMLCGHYGCRPERVCNRIGFEYVDAEG